MTAVRELIIQRVVSLFSGTSAQEIEQEPSGDPSRFPALQIYDLGHDPVLGEAGTERFILSIGIDGFVEGGSGAAARADRNALYAEVIEALFADGAFEGLAEEIEQGKLANSVADLASKRRLGFSLDIMIHFATARGAPQTIN